MRPVCLVTGGGGRLGRALCARLRARFDVVATYRRTPPPVSSQKEWRLDLSAEPPSAADKRIVYNVQADLEQRDDVRRLVEVATARFGTIDHVVNCAADTKFHGKLVEMWDDDSYARSQLSLNSIAPFRLVSAIHQTIWKNEQKESATRNRSVVNVSSVSGLYVHEDTGQAFYSASKAAMNILTMYLALELAPYSVRANAICPGRFVDAIATGKVVSAIERLIDGDATGQVVELANVP